MPVPNDGRGRRIYEADRDYVFHSWSAQKKLDPLVITSAHDSYVVDSAGTEYLDFSSQLVFTNLGHQHPAVVAAIQRQAAELCTIAPAHANEQRSEAARLIVQQSQEGLDRVFFTNAGAEAVENAVRMARLTTGRYKVLSQYRSYHGATATAINLTGDHRRWANDYGSSGAVHFFGPFLYRSAFHATTEEEECARALDHLETLIEFEGPASFAALILETVPGTAGIMPPPPGYLAGVRALCDRFGIVLIFDEVMVGFGRTGRWFAAQHDGVVPDLMTFAKGVNSGYVPLGGVIMSERIASFFDDTPYPGGMTYSGHPLSCAAAVATITTMIEEGTVENADMIGETVLRPGLAELAKRHPSIGEVRGLGAFFALDLVSNRETKEPIAPYGGSSEAISATLSAARAAGLLLFNQYHRIHLAPPCNITVDAARTGLAILDEVLDVTDRYVTA